MLSTIISSIFTFFLGRYLIAKIIKDQDIFNFWKKITNIINRYNWKASIIAHINPLFPGSSLGYLFGASKISFKSFLVGCFIGTIPLQLIAVFLGSSVS